MTAVAGISYAVAARAPRGESCGGSVSRCVLIGVVEMKSKADSDAAALVRKIIEM